MPAAETAPRAATPPRAPSLSFGPFTFDTRTRLLSRDGQEIALPPRVLGVLELLLDRAGDVVARQELIDAVWKDAFVTDTSLAEAVSVLRQALADDPQSPTYIQTLHRRGYRFVAPVSASAPAVEARTVPAPPPDDVVVSPSIGGQLVPWSAAVVCALIAAGAVWQLTHADRTVHPPAARFSVGSAPGTVFDVAAPALAFSPDGKQIAWSGCDASGCRLYVRPIDRLEASAVAGSDDGRAPFFSLDGRWIGFFADGRLKKVAVAGGTAVTLADAPSALGGVWTDRDIVFAGSPSGGLMRIAADGGDARPLTTPREADGEIRHAWPATVPGSRVLLFTIDTTGVDGAAGLLGALSLDATGGAEATRWRTLAAGVNLARAAASDVIVLAKDAELEAVAFDPVRLATAGVPRTVLSQVASARGLAHYALSATGSLVAVTGSGSASAGLAWLGPSSTAIASDEVRRLRSASLSPDGTRVAGVALEGGRADIWVGDIGRGSTARLTHSGINVSPVWSADGRTVFYASRTAGAYEIWSRDADGAQPAARRWSNAANPRHALPLATSADGRTLAFVQTAPGRHADIWALPLIEGVGGGEPRAIVQGPFDDVAAAFSPDSSMMAFQSADAGRWEISVVRLADGKRVVVSTDGGERPFWTAAGSFFESHGHLVRTSIAGDLRVEPLTRVADLGGGTLRGVSPDGRYLVSRADAAPSTATVSLDWVREARALIGPPSTTLPR